MKNIKEEFYPVALTVGVSDSGGAAGVQADLRTFNAAGVFGCSVLTAINAQKSHEVKNRELLAPALVKAQLESVIPALAVKAVKIGFLGSGEMVKTVSDFFRRKSLPLIVAPGMISSSGTPLWGEEAMKIMTGDLLHQAAVIVLDVFEAQWLLNRKLSTIKDCTEGAVALAGEYKCHVLLKGGALPEGSNGKISDIAVLDGKVFMLTTPKVNDLAENTVSGAGDVLASGIAAMIAAGSSWKDALRAAKAHVYGALCETAHVGKGLDGMYPALEDYSSLVSLRPLNAQSGRKDHR